MYSRAYILLERDLKELNQNNFVGITAFPITDDMLKWQAEIEGLQNSSLHGFVLQLTIEFTSEYNLAPPVVKFTTIPFHPNVKDDDMQSSQDQDKLVRSIKSISFNDYYKTWSRIATSKATESYRAPLLGDPHFIGEYYKWKKIDKGHPKEWKLKYAATKSHLARENKMLHQVHDSIEKPLWPTPDKVSTDSYAGDDDIDSESWEKEVDDLVAWTNTLSVDNLEDET
ncbi:ubiquitin-conjugating enzyme E2 U isoform X7 [Ictidomys tridecemlineatus]|uniref:ubiquitin-conjugating enzyme E2 U isoform X7 n=1 Tax=Ictidomys tridecemlineatus TaxID=43179 RepID=UPI001A9FC8D6|nr:ubiquitin-conjugating enzyme E2 U isoform X7 [Ictidomys tridecemlineatus]